MIYSGGINPRFHARIRRKYDGNNRDQLRWAFHDNRFIRRYRPVAVPHWFGNRATCVPQEPTTRKSIGNKAVAYSAPRLLLYN
jgi:hypothetical protein